MPTTPPPSPSSVGPAQSSITVPYQVLVEQSLVGIYVIQDGTLKYANAAFAAMSGHTPSEISGRRLAELVAPSCIDDVLSKVEERIRHGSSMRYTTRGLHKDGYEIDIEVHGSAVEFEGQPAVIGVAIDISERAHYERELRESGDLLRLLASHMTRVREEQRARIAHEIHDLLGGLLTSIKMGAARILNRVESAELAEIADELITTAQEGIEITREISDNLYPAILDHLGLEAAVRCHLERVCRRNDLQGDTVCNDALPQLPNEQALAAFRIFQEATTNIVRHADARRVNVVLGCISGTLCLEVCDDGRGLAASAPRGGAIGILGMQERARAVGGSVTLESRETGGTRLRLELPLPDPAR